MVVLWEVTSYFTSLKISLCKWPLEETYFTEPFPSISPTPGEKKTRLTKDVRKSRPAHDWDHPWQALSPRWWPEWGCWRRWGRKWWWWWWWSLCRRGIKFPKYPSQNSKQTGILHWGSSISFLTYHLIISVQKDCTNIYEYMMLVL